MRRALLFVVMVVIINTPYASAQVVEGGIPALNCVKKKIVGDATTYNPYAAGWKTGGLGLATGGTYNPDAWEAAIQLDIGREVGCGVGSGKTCRAVVSVPSTGRAAIVLINDNGPMCADPATYAKAKECQQKGKFARVIDLNKQSMYFLSNGKSGNNVGTLYNVEVAILDPRCGQVGNLGPLTGADKEAWAKIAASMPKSELPNIPASGNPYGGSPFSLGGQGLGVTSSQGAYPGYGGATASSGGSQTQNPSTPMSVGTQSTATNATPTFFTKGRSAGNLIVQPLPAKKGSMVRVSWSSVNMEPFSCKVKVNGEDFATGNEASKPYQIPSSASSSTMFTMRCVAADGTTHESSSSVSVQ